MSKSNKAQSPNQAARVTLLERVSAADAARLEAIHSRMIALGENSDVDATREVGGFVYEILKMPIVDKVRPYDPDKDYISDLFLELGQADAIVDLLYMVAAEAILAEGRSVGLKQEVAHAHN